MYARTSVAVLLAFAAYAAAKSSSSSSPSVDAFGFLSQSDFPEDFSLNKAQARCFESIARTKTLNALTAAGDSQLTCSGMKNLCSQCSSCSSFSTDPTQRCVCLSTNVGVTLTQPNSCLLVPLTSLLSAQTVTGSPNNDCIVVAGSLGSSFLGGGGDDVIINVNTGTNEFNGPHGLYGEAGNDCIIAEGYVSAYAYGDAGDDVVFQGSDAEFDEFSELGANTFHLAVSGGDGDDLVLVSGQAYTVTGGDNTDIIIVKDAAVGYVSDDNGGVAMGDDFVNIAGNAFVRVNVNAHGGDNTIIVGKNAVVGNIGGGPAGMIDNDKIYIYGGVNANVQLNLGSDYVYVGKNARVGGEIFAAAGDVGGDVLEIEGAVEDNIDLGDGENRVFVGSSGYVGGYIKGGEAEDLFKIEGNVYQVYGYGLADKFIISSSAHVETIFGGEGDDRFVVSGFVQDVYGEAGADVINIHSSARVQTVSGGDGEDSISVQKGAHVAHVYGDDDVDAITVEGIVAGGIYGGAGADNIHLGTDATGELVVDGLTDIVRIDDPNYKKLVQGAMCYVANSQIRVDCGVVFVSTESSSSNQPDSVSDSSILQSTFTVRSD